MLLGISIRLLDDPHQAVKTFLAVSLITGVFPPGFDAA